MSTPEHIKRIIERLEPVDQVAMDAYLAELHACQAQRDYTIAEFRQEMRERSAATIRGMAAARRSGYEALAQAQRLRAECSPEALESEREANEQLTNENQKLLQERDSLAAQSDRFRRELEYFVCRVEEGSIRSRITYARYVSALSESPLPSLAEVRAQAIDEFIDQWNMEAGGDNDFVRSV